MDGDRTSVESLLRSSDLPLDGLDDAWGHAVVAEDDSGRVVGVAALERYPEVGLLRSVAVREEARGQSLGRRLVAHMLDHAQHIGLKRLYLLTTTAEDWFERWGFRRVPRSELPEALSASAELSGACPDSATAMVRNRPSR